MTNPPTNQFLRPENFWHDIGLKANQTVVHLGCGAGYFLNPAARIVGTKGKVYGVDIREDMLREAENRTKRENLGEIITTVKANIENGPVTKIESDTSDWTLVINILTQSDPSTVLEEAKRITGPNGQIVIVEWSLSQPTIGPPVEKRIPKDKITEIITQLNLKIDSEFEPSPYHYGLLVSK